MDTFKFQIQTQCKKLISFSVVAKILSTICAPQSFKAEALKYFPASS